MLETLTWQAAFAIVASVVAITTGFFGYLIKTRNHSDEKQKPIDEPMERLKNDIVEIKERLIIIESEIKMLVQHGKNTNRRIDDHETQDRQSFLHIEAKIDKLTDILMRILSDDKL